MRKKQQEPAAIRFTNGMVNAIPGYTITNLSEADIRQLHDGLVPAWLHDTVAFWLRDNPKPGEVPPNYQAPKSPEAADAVDPQAGSTGNPSTRVA